VNYTFQWGQVTGHIPYLAGGAMIALQLAFFGFAVGMVIGAGCAATKAYGPKLARRFVDAYVSFFTNTPLLVQIFFLYYGLPDTGIFLDSYQAVLVGISLNAGAYLTEIQRAGFMSVRRTELDAAATLGFSRLQMIRYVVVPHLLKTLYAPLANHYIVMVLGTSIAAIFGVEELTGRALNVNSINFRSFEIFSIAAAMYITLTIAASASLYWFGLYAFRIKAKVF
jgi:polar amino acid transport system permease protein